MTNPDNKLAQDTTRQRKGQLREEMRRRLLNHEDGDGPAVVRRIAAYLGERPDLKIVAMFAALPGEVDLRTLPEMVDRIWALPKVVGGDLVFYRVSSMGDDMSPGAFGIMEPRDGLEEIAIGRVDLFLCPGLGFDLKGGRIGRGKGFYDRMLEKARPDALKLGICFCHQIVDEVVMDDHDVRMDGVITD